MKTERWMVVQFICIVSLTVTVVFLSFQLTAATKECPVMNRSADRSSGAELIADVYMDATR